MKKLLLLVPVLCLALTNWIELDKNLLDQVNKNVVGPLVVPDNAPKYVPDEVIVRFKDGVSPKRIDEILNPRGYYIKKVHEHPVVKFAVLKVPPNTVLEAIDYLKGLPEVEYAEPNYIYYAQVWHWMKNTDLFLDCPPDFLWQPYCAEHWLPNYTFLTKAWRLTKGSNSVILSIIDTGCAYETIAIPSGERQGIVQGTNYEKAQDLNNINFVIVSGADIVYGDDHPNDGMCHGTHCTSIAAQSANLYAYSAHHGKLAGGTVGVAPLIRIMPIRVMGPDGLGTLDNIAAGITKAADNGAHVLSLSLGGPGSTTLENACNYAYNTKGCLIFAASGNNGADSIFYPARYSSVIAVGAVDFGKNKTDYSNYGPEQELMAPGGEDEDLNADGFSDVIWRIAFKYTTDVWGNINATYPESIAIYGMAGTSMACPAAAAGGAMVKSISPNLTNVQIRNILDSTATDLGTPGRDQTFGFGLINYWKACSTAAARSNNPLVIIDSIFTLGKYGDFVWNNNDTVQMTVRVRNCGKGGSAINATITTSASFVSIIDNSSNYGTMAHWARSTGDIYKFAVNGADTLRGKPIFFQITFNCLPWSDIDTFVVYVGRPQIMLIEDDYHSGPVNVDGNSNYRLRNHWYSYRADLNQYCFTTYPDSNYHYAVWDVWKQGTPTYSNGLCRNDELKGYDAAIWFFGSDYISCFNSAVPDSGTAMSFMNNGGDLFLAGMDFLDAVYYYPSGGADPYNFPTSAFAYNYLRLSQVDYDVRTGAPDTAIGIYAGPPKTDDLRYHVAYRGYPSGSDSGWPNVWDDKITNRTGTNGGFGLFNGLNNNLAVKGYEGTYKLAFFEQCYENYIGNRAELMKRILDWFDLTAMPQVRIEESVNGAIIRPPIIAYQNPIPKGKIAFTLSLSEPTMLDVKVYDVTGSLVKTLGPSHYEKGEHRIIIPDSQKRLSSGIYFLLLETDKQKVIRKLILY
uniref:T9SS type A sorting domain-containing protein n=1 Tax=candidate division WOR-3 bacterium TaxID=2052148 RepID=A0A7C4TCD0_UNCW3